ncbi:adenosylmethionine decarboxylase [Parvibaculum sp.]|uniref:adenosylmethionine decarboxylase n=1 Tax=Parvibaculum sp. TaxID=2024848 RepID=UPI002717E45C|nr:adenosylmethionine decarboxylase [Parvibaculum sp.]MDO9128100.1 adenosylmethionine decarboxylase [Parvibaculum sp.]MDP1626638.1 adenosylmethionine decarboxylase [Parvibaculum sp.]MDP2150559.1 adenosylmethionine decarboxylase [Parvibaculum sp.]MDP3327845.1 adenosylmethionine decarboxylase [Parvibaculum sp.]
MPESNALFQLGIDLNSVSSNSQAEVLEFPVHAAPEVKASPLTSSDERKDFFIERDGDRFAGTHLIIDLIGASRLDDLAHIEAALRRCVEVSKATLLHIHLHHFTPNGGVSGVAVLSESHISIHSWPEADYAALDVFMCGDAEPHNAIEVLREAFSPSDIRVDEHRRGRGMV